MTGENRQTLALLALAALLAAVIAAGLRNGPWEDGAAPPAGSLGRGPQPPQVPASAALPAVDQAQWAETSLARPLFNRSRRPPAALGAAPVAAAAGLPRLAGVIVNGTDRSAILVPADGGRPVVAREGTRVGAFTVQAIQAGRVTILAPGGTRVLRPTPDANRLVPALAGDLPQTPGAPPLLSGLPPPPAPPSFAR